MTMLSRLMAGRAVFLSGLAMVFGLAACSVSPSPSDSGYPPLLFSAAGQYVVEQPARRPKPVTFFDAKGSRVGLDRFAGKVVLLNFWASWCAACAREIPSLDALSKETEGSDLAIVPVSVDRGGLPVARAFFRKHGVSHLPLYSDEDLVAAYFPPANPNSAPFMLNGLPKTFLIDRKGRIRGYIIGEVDWTSKQARKLLGYYLDGSGMNSP